jgi:hypothetical protein
MLEGMAVKIQFAQGMNVGNVGEALVGLTGADVIARDGNASPGSTSHYRWTWIDVPTLSAFPLGFITEGPVDNISFNPDVEGDYHLMVESFGTTGFKTVDRRVFRVELASLRALPAFDAEADALNFGGQTRGWKPDMEKWLLYIEALVSPGLSSAGAQDTLQMAGAVAGTFAAVTNVWGGNTFLGFGSGTRPISGILRFQATTGAIMVGRTGGVDATILTQGADTLTFGHDQLWNVFIGAKQIQAWSRAANGELYGGSVAATQILTWNENGVQIGGIPAFGSGQYVLGLRAAITNPSTNPAGGVALYCDLSDDYAIKYRKPSGQVVPLDSAVDPSINGFRLTSVSSVSIPTTDQANVTAIYLTPHKSAAIALHTGVGGRWVARVGIEFGLGLGVLLANRNYDVFAYWTGSAIQIEFSTAWTNDTTRADAISRLNGVWVKNSDSTRRYVGTIRTTSTTQTQDTVKQRFIWNADNQVRRFMYRQETAISWAVAVSGSLGLANSNALNCVEYVQGLEDLVSLRTQAQYRANAANFGVQTAIGIDSTTTIPAQQLSGALQNRDDVSGFGYGYANAQFEGYTAAGYHKANWLERQGGTGTTMFSVIQVGPPDWGASGIQGYLMG